MAGLRKVSRGGVETTYPNPSSNETGSMQYSTKVRLEGTNTTFAAMTRVVFSSLFFKLAS